jgi:hypothetical protein
MNIKNIDKIALGKAIGVLAMSWLALPILYCMFKKKKEVKNEALSSEGREDTHPE